MNGLPEILAGLSPERRSLLELLILEEARAAVSTAPKALRKLETALTPAAPASFGQERLWLLDRLDPGSTAYNLASGLRLTGTLDAATLTRSFEEIVRRHAVLRTTFREEDGRAVQAVGEPRAVELPVVDLSGVRASALQDVIAQETSQPFDLTRGPVYRVRLVRLSEQEHVLLATLHHIVSDAWSMGVLARELTAIHAAFAAGLPSPLSEPALQYADHARAQRERLEGTGLDGQLEYWRSRLAGAPEVVEVPPDRPRPRVRRFRGQTITRRLAVELSGKVARLCRERSATAFMVLLAAFEVLLHARSGETDLVVGVDIAGRDTPEAEALLGFFVNQLVLRVDAGGDPVWLDLLERVRETALGAFAHQDVPFDRLVEELSPQRSLSRNPLFQVMFGLYNVPEAEASLGDLKVEPVELEGGTAVFDLSLYIGETAEGLRAMLRYDADLFEPATAERLLDDFETVVRRAVETPGERLSALVEHLSAERRKRLESGRADLQKARLRTLKTARRRTIDETGGE